MILSIIAKISGLKGAKYFLRHSELFGNEGDRGLISVTFSCSSLGIALMTRQESEESFNRGCDEKGLWGSGWENRIWYFCSFFIGSTCARENIGRRSRSSHPLGIACETRISYPAVLSRVSTLDSSLEGWKVMAPGGCRERGRERGRGTKTKTQRTRGMRNASCGWEILS